jgi:hypothetical protein
MRRLLLCTAALLYLSPAAFGQAYGDPNSLVNYWYETFLGRAPDQGASPWVTQLSEGTPPDQVLSAILGSPEFYAKAGSTPEGFVTLLFQDALKRPPDPRELNFWVRQLYSEDRASVAESILTQNPGVWVGSDSGPPPAVVNPGVPVAPLVVSPGVDWDRDRHWDWDRHHDVHEYRRPDVRPPDVHRPDVRPPGVHRPEVRPPEVHRPEVRPPEVHRPDEHHERR